MKSHTRVLSALACAFLTSCLYYDSTWGQATAEQKRAAARLTAASVEGRRGDDVEPRRRATIRACATATYVAETLSWDLRFDELLRNANSVLEPALGLTLTNGGTRVWSPKQGEGSLATVIEELGACDGPETDWVVAFVGSTPSVVSDFHVLGLGEVYSPYLVMRAMNDPAELDALAQTLPDLDAAAREKLYSNRKRHKTLTVFLHELAHTLGAVHRLSKATIMAPQYDASEGGYDDATLSLVRSGLTIRLDHVTQYASARQFLERNPDGFVPGEREAELQLLTAMSGASGGATPAPIASVPIAAPPSGGVQAVPFETLSKEERQSVDAAIKVEATDPREAWQMASPLFELHPRVREIQELRCRLAKERKLLPAVVDAHCARLAALAAPTTTAAAP